MEFLPISVRTDLTNDFVPGVAPPLSERKRYSTSVDYKAHYYANHRAFFIIFALFIPVDILDSLLKGIPHFLSLGPIYFLSGVLYFAGLITAAATRNERYHELYVIFFLIQTIIVSFLIFQTLV